MRKKINFPLDIFFILKYNSPMMNIQELITMRGKKPLKLGSNNMFGLVSRGGDFTRSGISGRFGYVKTLRKGCLEAGLCTWGKAEITRYYPSMLHFYEIASKKDHFHRFKSIKSLCSTNSGEPAEKMKGERGEGWKMRKEEMDSRLSGCDGEWLLDNFLIVNGQLSMVNGQWSRK
jgi:hypothetical protein